MYHSIGATYLTFVRLDFISSLVIAACLTPTDPIISAAIVGECSPLSRDSRLIRL